MKKINKILLFTLLFLFFLIWNVILMPLNVDEIWNYGFSLAMFNGEIPYKDFNMILTPLYPVIMSLPFYIFGSNEIIFHITNVFMLIGMFYLLYDLLGEKSLLLLFLCCFPISIIFPSYNIFLLVLFVVLLWLEKNNKSDYLIGFLLACLCLTKQTVGVMLFLVGILFYIKDKKKIIKRIVGFVIPCIIFLFYLLVTKSVIQFFDLCLFGLLDFTSGNGKLFNVYVVIFLILVGFSIYVIKNHPKRIENWYILAFYSIMIPLFDMFHVQFGLLALVMLLMFNEVKFPNVKINIKLFVVGVLLGICITFALKIDYFNYPNDINRFEYRYISSSNYAFTKEVNSYIEKNKDKEIVFLNSDGHYFRIINNMPITYLDLINKGNWGYNGSNKLLKAIKEKRKAIFLVNMDEFDLIKQTDKRVLKYVIENGHKIGSIKFYDIYVFDEYKLKK